MEPGLYMVCYRGQRMLRSSTPFFFFFSVGAFSGTYGTYGIYGIVYGVALILCDS